MTISCQGPEPTYKLHVQSALISATGIGSEKAGQVVWQDFSSPSCELPLCERVALQASNGQYVVAEGGGGGVVNANRDAVGHWETFRMHQLGGGSVALQADNGMYLVAAGGGGGAVHATSSTVGSWEAFQVINLGQSAIALQASNGQYVVAEGGGGGVVNANRSAIGPWETFVLVILP